MQDRESVLSAPEQIVRSRVDVAKETTRGRDLFEPDETPDALFPAALFIVLVFLDRELLTYRRGWEVADVRTEV